MLLKFSRLRKRHCVRLVTTCLVLSVLTVWWDNDMVDHVKSYSFRFLVNRFNYINKSLTITREQAQSFWNFRNLLDHPDKCAGQDVLLLLFVKTSPVNTARRENIRSTWGNETFISDSLGVTVKVVFALGAPLGPNGTDAIIQRQLFQEDRRHSDLIQQDFLDSFHNLTLKLIMQFHWMHRCCAHARFLMTADDDVFVHMPNLVAYLQDARQRGVTDFWVGRVHRGAPPNRSKHSKYYVPFEMYQWMSYPDYTPGAGYVVSGDVASKIYHATLTLNATLHIDDVFMGICAKAVGVSPQEHLYFSGEGKAPDHPCIYNQMITSHGHVEDLRGLWKVATHPRVKERTSGLLGRLYCTAVKISLLCRYRLNGYPCIAAFY
ncbi:lactosylceramide 1,3-N-acetyl-beta-D-glucosaminyltransferase B [Syngnathoides biaculeatus]|uniref:lactosylceramide 1,3-N-acetyl-beta-D-glucosaminyltransferase B n=1 Tax=Syngnathoides biaculeatus TaxID=300417 RepID=UPI002ADD65D4|nr:lactosylceramide 1,3-N-acetyl-beta-D-glucosaminyltransferase B [Syngnathoides biaculeatus]XP_061695143.1 lactosylceramide 1,3-N-acetyl-beta-D-glucosaminyltransferase B [Syngnathoides biaculeatus]XP_061695144.1 lactosylceramide 1,3-N-acetyl-beta-D-glucosaminyltransferase B [Syngnathoides biaculeatus]XP_061695145.1 lactosylceramide 1,3-N-acetyl-beta-D-glucosaminyltransferase B [Syngnathoides biaculeatus]XP_061695146.1 lactosylceramide 1,3-N-acetyl-beta-D-glucosaminyltransferase B [Syngnathoide